MRYLFYMGNNNKLNFENSFENSTKNFALKNSNQQTIYLKHITKIFYLSFENSNYSKNFL